MKVIVSISFKLPASRLASRRRSADIKSFAWRLRARLFGEKPHDHRLFADHVTAESPTRTSGRGRSVDEWRIRPDRPDNHWLDCLVGAAVAASMSGVTLPGQESQKRERRNYSAYQNYGVIFHFVYGIYEDSCEDLA